MLQRTREWFDVRVGKVTASRMGDLMARTKTGFAAKRQDYLWEIVTERLTGKPSVHFETAAMRWGIEMEALARASYEAEVGEMAEEVGFVIHPELHDAGASPDGLVGSDGLVEIKCPETTTHLKMVLRRSIDERYMLQMQWQLECTRRCWCDFVSFDPRVDAPLSLMIIRFPRDDKMIAMMRDDVCNFLKDASALEDGIKRSAKTLRGPKSNA